eukprot:scaffold128593_cov32-Tisochrysis_lutea.AAC.2
MRIHAALPRGAQSLFSIFDVCGSSIGGANRMNLSNSKMKMRPKPTEKVYRGRDSSFSNGTIGTDAFTRFHTRSGRPQTPVYCSLSTPEPASRSSSRSDASSFTREPG